LLQFEAQVDHSVLASSNILRVYLGTEHGQSYTANQSSFLRRSRATAI